jgi:hypothetical protein
MIDECKGALDHERAVRTATDTEFGHLANDER